MILPGTYANGFYPRDGEPLFPELWRGCVGAWSPCLGPTGLVLRDWSGRANHGTLTNMDPASDWIPSGGRWALDFDGTNEYVSIPHSDNLNITGNMTISLRVLSRSAAAAQSLLSKRHGDDYSAPYQVWLIGGVFRFVLGGGGSYSEAVSSVSVVSNKWYSLLCTVGGTSMSINVDGVQTGSATFSGTRQTGPSEVRLGRYGNSTFIPFAGAITDLHIIAESAPQLAQIFATRPGIAHELAPIRHAGETAASYRRRLQQTQIIGGGMI